MAPLTAEKVANYLPLSGKMPQISGRVINVTHQIPYNISRSSPGGMVISEPGQNQGSEQEIAAAPVSKLARHHARGRTLRAKFRAAEWLIVQDRGHGALNAGLSSLNDEYQTLHIGWTGPIKDSANNAFIPAEDLSEDDKSKINGLLKNSGNIIPIFLDSKFRGHYEGYCKEGKAN